jgi:TolB protein
MPRLSLHALYAITLAALAAGCGVASSPVLPSVALPPDTALILNPSDTPLILSPSKDERGVAGADLPVAQVATGGENIGGRILFVKGSNIWAYADGRARQLTTGGVWRQPQWSPDGSEIAFVYAGLSNFTEIFVMNVDGSDQRRLTRSQSSSLSDNDWVLHPIWSPSGDQIVYVSDSDTYHPTVWLMSKDGSGKRQLLRASGFQEAADSLAWSPDGSRLAVTAFGPTVSQVLLVDVARGTTQRLTDHPKGAFDPAWSPDGSSLAYVVREDGRTEVRLRHLDGSPEVGVTRGGLARAPAWSPGGSRLAYLSAAGGSFELYVVDVTADGSRLSTSNVRQLTRDLNIDAASGLSWGR